MVNRSTFLLVVLGAMFLHPSPSSAQRDSEVTTRDGDEALRKAYRSSPEEMLVHYGRWVGVPDLRP
jgi:hypothetical protein